MRKLGLGLISLLWIAGGAYATDLTFFTCSDTHYNEAAASNTVQAALIDMINAIPGKEYPDSVGGGKVAVPRGVIVPGDLIDDGQGPGKMIQAEWDLWTADFGMTGEGRLKFPVYEGIGNHDLNERAAVEAGFKTRNQARSNVVAIASNGLHYAWEWDGIHFVQLNLYPGDVRPQGKGGQPPRQALTFLKEELAKNVGQSGKPVVIAHHYMPTDGWWSEEEKQAYYEAIKDYNVILITHGHQGRASIYDWKGITVVDNHAFAGTGAFVFHITPNNELIIAQRTKADQWGLTAKKTIKNPAPAAK